MLNALKFVQGAVAKKDFVPEMTHFEIKGGRITAFNGQLALSCPIPFDIDCKPKADSMVKAISKCEDTVSITMTDSNRLRVQSGKFKAFVNCLDGDWLNICPEGVEVPINGEDIIKAFHVLLPFIGIDASRAWGTGVLLDSSSAFATNNVCLVQYWLGTPFPKRVNIPSAAVKEMLRIKEAPIGMMLHDNSITFVYSGERWLRTQLLEDGCPDYVALLDAQKSNPHSLNDDVFEGLETIKPFVGKVGKIHFANGVMSTETDLTTGATYAISDASIKGIYRHEMFALLKGVAKQIDLTTYPKPCAFFGDNLRGLIIGMKE